MPQGFGFPARETELRALLPSPPFVLGFVLDPALDLLAPLLFVPLAMPVSDLVSYGKTDCSGQV
jgi:hypothetical protein